VTRLRTSSPYPLGDEDFSRWYVYHLTLLHAVVTSKLDVLSEARHDYCRPGDWWRYSWITSSRHKITNRVKRDFNPFYLARETTRRLLECSN